MAGGSTSYAAPNCPVTTMDTASHHANCSLTTTSNTPNKPESHGEQSKLSSAPLSGPSCQESDQIELTSSFRSSTVDFRSLPTTTFIGEPIASHHSPNAAKNSPNKAAAAIGKAAQMNGSQQGRKEPEVGRLAGRLAARNPCGTANHPTYQPHQPIK